MTWSYSGNPASSNKDAVRFLVGDTDTADQLVSDQEVNYAIAEQASNNLAAAMVLRALAAKFSRLVTNKVGDVSANCSDMAKAFQDRADALDPGGITTGTVLASPSFGGLSQSEKDAYDSNSDAVQPDFRKSMNDIPGGPDNQTTGRNPWFK